MRIVHVTRQFPPGLGGIEEVVAQLVEAQARAGHDVRVLTLDRIFTDPDTQLVARDEWMGAEVLRFPYRGSMRYPLAPAVLGHVRDADVVHVHAIDFFFDFMSFTRGWHRRPMVATTHGGFFHTDAHARLKRLWFSTVTRAAARGYDRIVACSQPDFDMFAAVAGDNLTLIENGVDIGKFADLASRAPTKNLVAIGRFSFNKKPDRLLDAMAELGKRDPAFSLDLIGGEFDWTREKLAAEIATRDLQRSVRLHVGASNAEIAEIVSRASLFVSASVHEGFGISLIEALSAGLLPVVEANAAFKSFAARVSDVALTDYARPAVAADAVVQAQARLAADPAAMRARLVAAAQPFAWPGVAERYMRVYEEAAR
ncbi:MAG TPA: glycosyltransferase family 4 protein [Rhodoblastus sp.]|nr:glycosyltransferase family 4 protein [Rhodoblastus sp.]